LNKFYKYIELRGFFLEVVFSLLRLIEQG
jgi:hypothetical protein